MTYTLQDILVLKRFKITMCTHYFNIYYPMYANAYMR